MYLFDVEISKTKSLLFALKSIYGLNKFSLIILKKLGLSSNIKVKYLSTDQITKLISFLNLSNILLANNLKLFNFRIFKNLISLKSVKSIRLLKGLPVRGQRTHTNAKTAKKKLFLQIIYV